MTPPDHKCLIRKMSDVVDAGLVKLLNEGEFKSYPADIVKMQLERWWFSKVGEKNDDFFFKIVPDLETDLVNDIQVLVLTTDCPELKDEKANEQIGGILRRSGWYIGDAATDGKIVQLSLEPRYPIVNNRVTAFSARTIDLIKTFYHVTFKKYVEKIMRNGLQPSFTKRREFYHPERIYLFGDVELAVDFLNNQSDDAVLQAVMTVRKIGNSGKTADLKYQDKTCKSMTLLCVDLKQMQDDGKTVKLYHDNRWDADSPVFFTQNSINPEYIRVTQTS